MKTGKEKILWVFYAGVLALLFLLSSTDLIIKEQKTEVYSLSVLIEGTGEARYLNFRKGMDRAAIELNADVSFISLYEENNQHQQLEMMVREQQDGARALIVTPTKEMSMSEALADQNITVPLVLVNSGQVPDRVFGQISAVVTTDYFAMGEKLAGEVMRHHPDKPPVWMFSGVQESEATWQFEEGICTTISQSGYEIKKFHKQDEEMLRRTIGTLMEPEEANVIIALDQESLSEIAAILSDSNVNNLSMNGLYGRGTTVQILNYLDRGVITGICVTDDFSAGYISVKRAVEAVTDQLAEKETLLESYYIEKEDLKKRQYEKMLYPID